jgi:uncharacterized phage-associated protein
VEVMDQPLDPVAVANTFIKRYGASSEITHMKLQKLCYYAYGWWLALCPDEPVLMQSRPQVWKLGPVFHPIYSAFASHKNQRIAEAKKSNPFAPAPEVLESDDNESQVIDWIWGRYGGFSAVQLSDMTHEPGTPWRKKVEECEFRVPRFLELSDDEIRPFFLELARKEGFIAQDA